MKKRRILRSERGFTLVELGIVMAIIAILAAVAYPTYTNMRKRAYIAEVKATLQEVRINLWANWVEYGNWPGLLRPGQPAGGLTVPTVAMPTGLDNWTVADTGYVSADTLYKITATGRGGANGITVVLELDPNGNADYVVTGGPT